MTYAASRAYFTERFSLAMSPRDRTALKRLSDVTGEAQAVIVRGLIRDAARQHGLWPPKQRHLDQEVQARIVEMEA